MPDKEEFVANWLQDFPNDTTDDAMEAWADEVKFVNQFNDWDNQL